MNDLTGPLGLFGGFLQRTEQFFLVNLLCLDARDHAVAVVVDGSQGLVEFVGHTRGHFAHGDQAAGILGALVLHCRLLLGDSAAGDVGSNHHLRQATIDPTQVAGAHLQPLVQGFDVHLGALNLALWKQVGGQAGEDIHIAQRLLRLEHHGHARLRHQAQMATCRIAKPQSIQLVGKQQLIAAQWRHGD